MKINTFSNFPASSLQGYQSPVVKDEATLKAEKRKKVIEVAKTVTPIAVSLAAIPVTAIVATRMTTKKVSALNDTVVNELKEQIRDLSKEVAKSQVLNEQGRSIASQAVDRVSSVAKKDSSQIWGALIALAGMAGAYKVGDLSDDDKKQVTSSLKNRVNNIDEKASRAEQQSALSSNNLGRKYTFNHNGIQLLKNIPATDSQKYAEAIKKIQTAAPKFLYRAPNVTPITKEHPTLWSVTSEFAPIKEGGLGSVPVEIQNNVAKLGINIPTFIPMYQQKGNAVFRQEGNQYFYTYKNKEYKLEKAATFKLDTYQDGKSKTEDVEIYVCNTGDNKQLVFVKNDTYFNGTIYQPTEKTEEPEKFAFFSKAVYEFAKAKEDPKSVKGLNIVDKNAFDSVISPDALVLNDWQASSIAALARYKAPLENAYGQLSDEASKKLSDMTIITIGHNAMYQGSTRDNNDDAQRKEVTSNILNTLFDNFAYDIVTNAKTGAYDTNPKDTGLKNLDNVVLLNGHNPHENHTNLLNMGVCLSNYFHPVSENYAKEITSGDHPELAGELRWALSQRDKAGSLVGIINGNDFDNLSIEAKKGQIKSQTDLDFKTYNKSSSIDEIMQARLSNKIDFYNNYVIPFSEKQNGVVQDAKTEKVKSLSSRLENVGTTKLPKLSDEELADTPIITSVGRLVSQKGIGIMSDAIDMLMKNWEKDFPGKPKPIFYLAGQDGEGGVQRKYIEDLKNTKLSKEDSNRVIFAHGFAPMAALTAGSDFFLLPSIFEPCGLTQGESFAVATPVIGSAVGGIVDTVNRNGKTNGILTDKDKSLTAERFYNAMKNGLEIYFNNPMQYQKMVQDALAEDFSWIQPNKQGPVFDYLSKLGINLDSLPEIKG